MECLCKRCDSSELVEIDDYESENDLTDTVELVKAKVCTNCGCAHWENETNRYWEYVASKNIITNQVAGWATNKN